MSILSTTSQIIEKFELFAGDETELSSSEELDLCEKIYREILASEEWEFLKKPATGTLSTSVDYVAMPTDFDRFSTNQYNKKVVYIGDNYDPYEIIPYDERRLYRNMKGYAYYDARQNRLYFTAQPTEALSYEFDYLYTPDALTTAGSNPVFPNRFYDVLYHGMLIDNPIIQMSEKARSYQGENAARFAQILNSMKMWNKSINNKDTYGI